MAKSSKQAILAGVSWTVIQNIINAVYGFISVPLLLLFYGKSDYGLIVLAMSINVYLRLLDLGFNSTNVKYYSYWIGKNQNESVKKMFSTSLFLYGIIGLVNCIVLLIVGEYVGVIFSITSNQEHLLKYLVWILSASACISWYSSCFNQLVMASENVGWVQKLAILPKILQMAIILLVYVFHIDIVTYFFLATFAVFVTIPFTITKIRKMFPFVIFKPYYYRDTLMEILPYSFSVFCFSIFQLSQESLRPILLGIRTSSDLVAEYKVIGSLVSVTLMIGGSFMSPLLPSASKATSQDNRKGIELIAYQGTKFISIILSLCVFGLISIHQELLILYVGRDFLHLSSWLIVWALCMLFSHNQGISAIILAGDDIRLLTLSSAIASVSCLLVCWFLLPFYALGATVIGYFVYCIIQFCFYYLYYWRIKLHLNTTDIFLNSFLRPALLAGVACLSSVVLVSNLHITNNIIYLLLFKGGLFLLFFCLYEYFVVLNKTDKQLLLSFILKH